MARVERKGGTGPVGQSQSKGHLEVAHRCRFLRATFKGQGLQHRFIGSVLNYPWGLGVMDVSESGGILLCDLITNYLLPGPVQGLH